MNDFFRLQEGMRVTAAGHQAVGLKGIRISAGTVLTVEQIFEYEGRPYLNLSDICDAFPAEQFMEYAIDAVPA